MTKHLLLQPLDVWLFRNGKPFNQGSDHRAESVFPPLPSVLQGAIRSHYIELHGGIPAYLNGQSGLEDKIGQMGGPPPAGFSLRGPFLADTHEGQLRCYVPLPAHTYPDGDIYRLAAPDSTRDAEVSTNLPADYQLLWRKPEVAPSKGGDGGWLSIANLQTLLREGELCRAAVNDTDCFFKRESRLGIQLNDQIRTSATGMLYEAEFVRLEEGYGLYVGVEGLDDLPDSGVMGLGGEGHAAMYRTVAAVDWQPIKSNANGFTITFLTPTYFEQGWQPANWQKFLGDSVTCVAAAVDKPLVLGGFDLAHKRHKPSYRYVQAGSTYFFRGTPSATPQTICDDLIENNQIFNPGQIGFGQYISGEWS